MTAVPEAIHKDRPSAPRKSFRVLGSLAVLILAILTLRFYIRDPLHYILDHSETSFGFYWPRRWSLLLHIAGGTLALFMGPFQLWTGLRRRFLHLHRWTGTLYVAGILLGGGSAFYMSAFTKPSDFGVSLFVIAVAWWITTSMAILAICRHQVLAHREWMTRSYVVTFAFVLFRLLVDLPVLSSLGDARLATLGWVSWVIPLLVAEVALQWKRTIGSHASAM